MTAHSVRSDRRRPAALAAALLLAASLLAPAPSAQSVPGFQVTTYSSATKPSLLAFTPDGTLFTGADAVPLGSATPMKMNRIGVGGSPASLYGATPISDPDTVVMDVAGTISGVPGTLLVAGLIGSSSIGRISGILPDQSVVTLFDNGNWANIVEMKFDHAGRFVFTAVDSRSLWTSTGGAPTILATLPGSAYPTFVSIGPDNRIAVGASDNVIRIYDANGALLNGSLASVGKLAGVEYGPGGPFGADIYALDSVAGTLVRVSSAGVKTTVGTGFPTGLAIRDIEFSPARDLFVSIITEDRILRISATWTDLGLGLAGLSGVPVLAGTGSLQAGEPMRLDLFGAKPNSAAALVVGFSAINAPFKGGTLVPAANLVVAGLPTGPGGSFALPATWPAGLPSGTSLYFQEWIADAGGPHGFAATNGLRATTP